MGQTRVTVEVRNIKGGRKSWDSLFLVDTGATDCLIPRSALKRLGVTVEGQVDGELADGSVRVFDYGFVRVRFMGQETVCHAVFGPEEAEPLLGVVALENTGIAVDPKTHSLKRLHAKSLKSVRGRASHPLERR
jgi:clan AA aspartic protease